MTPETIIKQQIKDYLNFKGIFNFPLLQGIGSFKGLPDRIFFYKGKAVFCEIKKPTGKLSEHQQRFSEQCQHDGIDYIVIRSIEDLEAFLNIKN